MKDYVYLAIKGSEKKTLIQWGKVNYVSQGAVEVEEQTENEEKDEPLKSKKNIFMDILTKNVIIKIFFIRIFRVYPLQCKTRYITPCVSSEYFEW